MRRKRGEPKPGEVGPPKPKSVAIKEFIKKDRKRFSSRGPRVPDVDDDEPGYSGRGYWRRGGLGKYRPGG